MAIRADSFAKKLRKFANDLPNKNNEIKKALIIETATQVVADTPILTGQAQNNYFFTVGSLDRASVLYGPFNGARGGTMSLARAQKAASTVKPRQPVYMTNNLPYIGRLNDGYSTQAPARFVQTAIARARQIIDKQRVRYGA